MPVPSTITDLDTTAANNSPAGSEAIGTSLDDYLRAAFSILRRTQAKGANIASAATVNIGATTDGNYVHITGTTTITSFGTIGPGISRVVVFDGALTLTHNATSLILPGGASITTAAGDALFAVSEGSGNWKVLLYQKANGTPIALGYTVGTAANNLVQLNGSGQLPAVDGSLLTGVSSLPSQTGNSGKVLITNGTSAAWGNSTGVTTAQSMIRLNTANGYGSTNTKIRRFTNTVTSQGSDITYTDSATLGGSFTINTNGVYAISYTDQFNAVKVCGLSLNTTAPTTDILVTPVTEILAIGSASQANLGANASWIGYLPAGSVVRAHTEGDPSGTSVNACQFTIQRVS